MSWRTVTERKCPTCRAEVLAGIDNDSCGLNAITDPTPIGPAGEFIALMSGRTTYRLRWGKLYRREPWHITDGTQRGLVVLAEHRCGCQGLPGPERSSDRHTGLPRATEGDEPCPY